MKGTISPAMTDAEVIRALTQINMVRAGFDAAPMERRTPIYTLPATPSELADALFADYVTPQHLVYEECCVADVVADTLRTTWFGVVVTGDEGVFTSAVAPSPPYGYPDHDYEETPGDFWFSDFPCAGVKWTPDLAKLAAYYQHAAEAA
jgi:hypothetical protein